MTHPFGIALRSMARRSGLVRLIGPLLQSRAYEETFAKELLDEIRSGDCVWDVGANVGLYTLQMAQRVGSEGYVVAFEPSPRNFSKLELACRASRNVRAMMCALGSQDGALPFRLSEDDSGVTDRIRSEHDDPSPGEVDVRVVRGDEFAASTPQSTPNVLKIDVEGFENEVISGMGKMLADSKLRALFVEIHFGALERRGMKRAPLEIAESLCSKGFNVKWLDHSHLVARR